MSARQGVPDGIDRWLAAEATGRETEAERLLGELFAQLPEEVPSPWFVQRVMAALPARRQSVVSAWLGRRWARPAVAGGLIATGLSAALGPGLLYWLFGSVKPSAVIGLGVSAFVGLCRWFAGALAFWEWLGALAAPLARTAGTLPFALALALVSLTATLALVSLSELMARERSTYHAHLH